MNAEQMFKKLEYERNVEREKILLKAINKQAKELGWLEKDEK